MPRGTQVSLDASQSQVLCAAQAAQLVCVSQLGRQPVAQLPESITTDKWRPHPAASLMAALTSDSWRSLDCSWHSDSSQDQPQLQGDGRKEGVGRGSKGGWYVWLK